MVWQQGDIVGQYRIERPLGQGGMASVYLAYHERLDRHVAIKVMRANLLDDESFTTRFTREAQIVARLEHPHIVPIYDFSTHEGQPYLVMKYIEGITLKERMVRGHMSYHDISAVMTAVASALDYAHHKGVLHRDVKPSNIVITHDSVPYLTDFGLARLVRAGESTMSVDMLLGTPHYLSPEQARGQKDLDGRADIYSLGIVLYELLTGRVPFLSDSTYAIIHDHINTPPPAPRTFNGRINEATEAVLLRALAKDRDDRYAHASELVQSLNLALSEVQGSPNLPDSLQEIDSLNDAIPSSKTTSTGTASTITYDTLNVPSKPSSTPLQIALQTPSPSTSNRFQTGVLVAQEGDEQTNAHSERAWIAGGCAVFLLMSFVAVIVLLGAADTLVQLGQLINRRSDPTQLNLFLPINPVFSQLGVNINNQDDLPSIIVPDLGMATAMDLKVNNDEDFVGYLVLANAYLQEQRPADSWQTIAEGLPYAPNPLVYLVSAAKISQRNFDPLGAVSYAVLALYLAENDPSAYRPIRNQMGEIIYEFAPVLSDADVITMSNQILTPDLLSPDLELDLPSSNPALYADALRQFGQGDYDQAQTTSNQINPDKLEAERQLLQAEIAYALGNEEQSLVLLTNLSQTDDLPRWLSERVQALLQAKDTP